MNDNQRKNPPKIGTIITYRFQLLTRDGVPRFDISFALDSLTRLTDSCGRFPSFVGEAIDKDEAKDAEIPEHRKEGVASELRDD